MERINFILVRPCPICGHVDGRSPLCYCDPFNVPGSPLHNYCDAIEADAQADRPALVQAYFNALSATPLPDDISPKALKPVEWRFLQKMLFKSIDVISSLVFDVSYHAASMQWLDLTYLRSLRYANRKVPLIDHSGWRKRRVYVLPEFIKCSQEEVITDELVTKAKERDMLSIVLLYRILWTELYSLAPKIYPTARVDALEDMVNEAGLETLWNIERIDPDKLLGYALGVLRKLFYEYLHDESLHTSLTNPRSWDNLHPTIYSSISWGQLKEFNADRLLNIGDDEDDEFVRDIKQVEEEHEVWETTQEKLMLINNISREVDESDDEFLKWHFQWLYTAYEKELIPVESTTTGKTRKPRRKRIYVGLAEGTYEDFMKVDPEMNRSTFDTKKRRARIKLRKIFEMHDGATVRDYRETGRVR